MPAILDSLFHKVVDTTSTPIGAEDGGGRCYKGVGPSDKKIIYGQMANGINSGCFRLHISQNVATYIDAQSHQPVLW